MHFANITLGMGRGECHNTLHRVHFPRGDQVQATKYTTHEETRVGIPMNEVLEHLLLLHVAKLLSFSLKSSMFPS